MVKIALNGGMPKEINPDVPTTVDEYSEEIRWFVEQGLRYFHIHFRDAEGMDSLEQAVVQPQWEELKARFPQIQIGVGSPLLFGRTQEQRMEQVGKWEGWKPDYISVNVPEEGTVEFMRLLREKGVPMEVSCFTMEDARVFVENGYIEYADRVLIEVSGEKDGPATIEKARSIYEFLHSRYPKVEYLVHGEDIFTWDVIGFAKKEGLSWRIGMEDVATDEQGNPMHSNRALYEHALEV